MCFKLTRTKIGFSLLFVTLFCAVLLGGCWPTNNGAQLESMGFRVEYQIPHSVGITPSSAVPMVERVGKRVWQVSEVEIDHRELTDSNLRAVAQCANLRRLSLRHVHVPENWCLYLSSWPKLENLDLAGLNLSRTDVLEISKLQNLTSLLCVNCDMADTSLLLLSSNRALSDLNLANTSISDAGLDSLKGIATLRRLTVTIKPVNSRAATILASMPTAIDVNVSFVGCASSELFDIAKSARFKTLKLDGMALDRPVLLLVSHLPALENLQITDCQLTETNLLCLTNSHNLHNLRIDHSQATPATLQRLRGLIPTCDVYQ